MGSSRAPAAPARYPVWSAAQKTAVGTALPGGRVWFTIARGIVTEVFYPRVDIPQIRDLGFVIADDRGFWQELKTLEGACTVTNDARVPMPLVCHRHPRFLFTFTVCTDPARDVLLLDFTLTGDAELRPYFVCAARLGEDADHNCAFVGEWGGRAVLWAEQGPFALALALACRSGAGLAGFARASVGEVGASDLWQDFQRHGRMTWAYREAGPGEVALGASLPRAGTLALGFGSSKEAAASSAWSSLAGGFAQRSRAYRAAWRSWHERHPYPPALLRRLSPAAHGLYVRSLNVIKTHEDRTFPGAIVASLSVPWGESSRSRGGYHLVWPRDLVESATALLAAGAVDEARRTLAYLIATQQADGHWWQNQWLGGKPFWNGVQLDETAFPVLLAAALAAHGALADVPIGDMVTRALRYLVQEGPSSAQDRWEEDTGINAFTLAVMIAALVEGAAFLKGPARDCALMVADCWNAHIEDWTYVRGTALAERFSVPGYYLRVAPPESLGGEGANGEWLRIKNRAHDPHLAAAEQVATDFLQLVRYGLRAPDDPAVRATLVVADGLLKTDTPNGPVWHRYNGDGYGETVDGGPFGGAGRGRGWPLLVGERGHYALAAGEDPIPYIESMAAMVGAGGLLPEQVWDAPPIPERGLAPGRPSGSAMPLVWAHAEFLKLCRSLLAGRIVDRPEATWARYGGRRARVDYGVWGLKQPITRLPCGQELRILLPAAFTCHWGRNGWRAIRDQDSEDWGLGHVAVLPTRALAVGETLQFTIRWRAGGEWLGRDYALRVTEEARDDSH